MELNNSSNSKRIAKNTLLLYFRMLLLMLISLYTSRVILNALGVEDYGIYNVVGGVVTMFSMLSGSLSAAISRFITFELGTGDNVKLKKVFSSSVTIQVGIALIIIVIAESFGLWFLNQKIVIPENRITAANCCFQFSIITFSINLISVPYNAAIIAHEKMSAFAYISILEAIGKLAIAWLIGINPIDRLIFFGGMVAVLAIFVRFIYGWYCKRNFVECTYHFVYDHCLLKQMFGFAGWNFIGSSAGILRDHGGTIMVNMFFGPTVNAAMALAMKVNATVYSFVTNFMTAINPQITKSYASGEASYMFSLIFRGARYSFYLLLAISLPILLNTHYLLELWLKIVPAHTVLFVQLILLLAMSESISVPLITAMLATGDIKKYQIIVGGLQLLNLPVSYICLMIWNNPEVVTFVAIIISQFCLVARLLLLHNMIGLRIRQYMAAVYLNVITVMIISSIIPCIIRNLISESIYNLIIVSFVSFISVALVVFFIGSTQHERQVLCYSVKKACHRFFLIKG